ncbi:MAG: BamA/TamA family outer membrane protein [bacterium]|nr:BamA/TamA family outer membrane protein [bacterium]
MMRSTVLICCVLLAVVPVYAAPYGQLVSKVQISGLNRISESDLSKIGAFKVRRNRPLYPDDVRFDMRALYLRGYFESVKVNFDDKGKGVGVYVTYQVVENPTIQRIEYVGMTRFWPLLITTKLKNKPGQVFNSSYVEDDIKALEDYYHSRHYDLFAVTSIVLVDDVLRITVEEGHIGAVVFEGLEKTEPFIVERTITEKKGDIFNSQRVRRDRSRLLRSGYFSGVSIPQLGQMNSASEDVTITYKMTEKNINQVDVGLEQIDEDNGDIGVAAFLRLTYNHLFMTSDRISLKPQIRLTDEVGVRSYSMRYYQPWLMNLIPISWALDGWTEFRNEALSGQDNTLRNVRSGVGTTFGIPIILDELTFSTTFKSESVQPRDGDDFQSYDVRSLAFVTNWDTRINRFNSREGRYVIGSVERAGYLGAADFGGVNFTRWTLHMAQFIPTPFESAIAMRGFIGKFDRDDGSNVPTFESEEFSLGGSTSLRGYPEFEFSGVKRALANFEWRFPLGQDVHGVLFYDVGNVFDGEFSGDMSDYRTGHGFGLRYVTGLAPFRLDFAWGEVDKGGDFIIHFNLGHLF